MGNGNDDWTRNGARPNMARKVDTLSKGVEHIAEKVERLLDDIDDLRKAVQQDEPVRKKRGPKATREGPPPVAQNFRIENTGKGRARVSFDGGTPVDLSPALTALIAILTSDDGESLDELVAWRSPDRICELLQKRLGREFGRHSVSQLLWRLQGKLGGAGLDVRLIEKSPLGVRLRLKKHAPVLFAG